MKLLRLNALGSAVLTLASMAAGCGGGASAPQDTLPTDPPLSQAEGIDRFLLFPNPQRQSDGSFQTDTPAYAQAYYAAVDPAGSRTTLADWMRVNGFGSGSGEEVSAVFGDSRDLGYGRRMTGRRNADGTLAFFVENYLVNPGGGYADTALSIDAALAQDARWRVGINAIEFSPAPGGTVSFAKFFNFHPVTGAREGAVDLDGRGAKAMPGVCLNCHGGRVDALVSLAGGAVAFRGPKNSASPEGGDALGRLHGFEVDTFRFADQAGWRKQDQQAALKRLNQFVLCSYPRPDNQPHGVPSSVCNRRQPAVDQEWQGSAAPLLMQAYGGDGMPNDNYEDKHVPDEWVSRGQATLYREVVATSCRACHLLRGTGVESSIDFDSFTQFESHARRIKAHAVDRGNMPLAKIVYDTYWNSGAPALMAQFLESNGLTARDAGGALLRPGRPVADPGPARVVKTGLPVRLSAEASLHAEHYQWTLDSGPADALLSGADQAVATLTPMSDGAHVLSLVVARSAEQSAPVTFTVFAKSALAPTQDEVRLAQIKTVLAAACVSCHQNSNVTTPVSFRDDEPDEDTLYAALRSRINFTDIGASPLLTKPAGQHHGGNEINGFKASLPVATTSAERASYDLFLDWALAGAPRN